MRAPTLRLSLLVHTYLPRCLSKNRWISWKASLDSGELYRDAYSACESPSKTCSQTSTVLGTNSRPLRLVGIFLTCSIIHCCNSGLAAVGNGIARCGILRISSDIDIFSESLTKNINSPKKVRCNLLKSAF
ncbi:MAG: hypothetical protein QG670_2587 [Thermoproteota archaeon]|nr:hypothetical protein [Thermoproteota archaeon]